MRAHCIPWRVYLPCRCPAARPVGCVVGSVRSEGSWLAVCALTLFWPGPPARVLRRRRATSVRTLCPCLRRLRLPFSSPCRADARRYAIRGGSPARSGVVAGCGRWPMGAIRNTRYAEECVRSAAASFSMPPTRPAAFRPLAMPELRVATLQVCVRSCVLFALWGCRRLSRKCGRPSRVWPGYIGSSFVVSFPPLRFVAGTRSGLARPSCSVIRCSSLVR